MKGTTTVSDFKDLKKAIEEITKNQPAETRYEKQAKVMGYTTKDTAVVEAVTEDEITRAKDVIALTKRHEREKKLEKDKIDKEKERAKSAADRAKNQPTEQTMSEASAFDGMTDIVNTKGAKKVEGVMIDMFTASVIVKAYTKVNASNKEKMRKANVHTLVALAQKVMGLKASNEFGKDPLKGFPYNETKESIMSEGAMSDMLIDIQQGATAKELSKTWKIPMSMAKDFLKSYYGQKKGPRKEEVKEGTWQTPKNKAELRKLQALVAKPVFATKPSDIDKYMKQMPFGDDELYDDLESLFYPKDSDGKIIYPIKRMKKFPKTDLNQVAMDSLNGRWLTVKKKGAGYDITHIMFDYDVEEKMNRKSGSMKPKKRMLVDLKESLVTKSPFKLKSKQYPRAIAIESKGYGRRHASQENIEEACESFGMITNQELQIEQIQKTLGKLGFLTYNTSTLNDIFEDRETQRMILALESVTETQVPTEYDRATIDRALEEELHVEFVKPDGMKAVGPVLKMSSNTYNLKDMYTGKSFTFKYIDEDTKVKTFNQIINEGKFPKKLVKQAGGIAFDKRYVGGNYSGAVNAIEKLKKGLSDDPDVKDMLRIANEAFNSQIFKSMTTEDQDAYVKFFQSALKKFGVNSPAELDTEKKKEFFNYIDKNYKAKDEMSEGKYTAYSDLLVMKARIIDKEGPKSDKLPAVDSQIRIVMKRLGVKEDNDMSEATISHQCATHVEHALFGSGTTVSGQHTLVQEDSGEYVVTHYDVEFSHGLEEMVAVKELAITKQEGHQHAMAKKAGRKKLKGSWKKEEQSRVDGRRKNFREKMRKLGYIKGR